MYPELGHDSAAGAAMTPVLSPQQRQRSSRQQRRRRTDLSSSSITAAASIPTFTITPPRAQQPFTFTVNPPNVQPRLRVRQSHQLSRTLQPSCLRSAPPSSSSSPRSNPELWSLCSSLRDGAAAPEQTRSPSQHSDAQSRPSPSPSASSSRQPVYRRPPLQTDRSAHQPVQAPTRQFVWPAAVAPSPPLPSSSPQQTAVGISDDEADCERTEDKQTAQSVSEEKERELGSTDELKDSTPRYTATQEEDDTAAAEQLETSREAERAALRSRCQQFILQLVAHPDAEARPPWHCCAAGDAIAAEYEPLYQQLLSAVKSRERESSKDPTLSAMQAGRAVRGSVTSSSQRRHSFSLLLPAFHTLHAVARQVMMSRRKEKEAEENGEQQHRNAVDPSSPLLPLADAVQPDRAAPADPQLQPLFPLSAAPSSRRPRRVFYSRWKKTLELRAMREARTAAAASSSPSSALSATSPLPLSSPPPLLSVSLSATTPLPVKAPPLSAAQMRRASLLAAGADRLPSSPSPSLSVLSQSLCSAVSSPRIIAHPFVPPRAVRSLQLGSEAESALYVEKLEASEQSRQRCRERRERDERRRRWAERMQPKDVKKWGRRGRKRRVRMRVEDGFLLWGAAEQAQAGQREEERRRRWRQLEREGKVIDLRCVRGIVPGLNPRLRARVPFSLSVLCFGVLGSQRALECECADVMDRDDWMDGLLQEVEEAKTMTCSWSGRLLMSVAQDTSITLTIAEGDEGISFI